MSAPARRVLAIDDSLTIRKLLEMALGRAGFVLELASSGQEGIQRALRARPDLVLLDYVLPDMKGLDVARGLWADERTSSVPIVVMSAKSDDLRGLFRELPSVVEFVGKPFTPSEIAFLVGDVLARFAAEATAEGASPATDAAPAVAFSFAQKEAAARAMFALLRERFARIPEWARSLGDASPAVYFARKILTPDLLDGLLGALVPTVREGLGAAAPAEPSRASSSVLAGQTSLLPLAQLLQSLDASGRTGMLRLGHPSRRTFLFLRRGRLVLASHDQPEEDLRQSIEDLSLVPPPELDRARAEQAATGKPLYATLAEGGRFPAAELARVLYQQGKRALLAAIEAGPAAFDWTDLPELPGWVQAFGSRLSLAQIQLERLRAVDDWAQVELHVDGLDVVFRRSDGFDEALAGFELTDSERRVLTLVNDRHGVRQIIEASGVPPFEVFHCLFRLSQVGLVRKRDDAGGSPDRPAPAVRPVAVIEPDREGVREPLARLLAGRGRPVPLVEIPTPDDLIEICLKERPRLLILNVSANIDAPAAARALRGILEISDTALAAVSDRELDRPEEDELRAAGFDAVLVKPFLFTAIERFIAA
ncbi:MAG: response regulator [Vicinamibacteria bacterium]